LAYGIRVPFAAPDGTPEDTAGGRYLVLWRKPKAGEVVVFWTPLGELAVKRIGEALSFEPAPDGTARPRYLLFGDNSVESYDSRSYGPVSMNAIVGKVTGNR
jgi:signal peptidase I